MKFSFSFFVWNNMKISLYSSAEYREKILYLSEISEWNACNDFTDNASEERTALIPSTVAFAAAIVVI